MIPLLTLSKFWRQSPKFVRFSHYNSNATPKITIPQLHAMAAEGKRFATITAHDCISARFAAQGGCEVLLVGDSLSMVAMGAEDTGEITLEDMIYHSRACRRGAPQMLMIADMPFGSYELGPQQAMASAVQMIKKGGVEVVKLEGGSELVPTIKMLSSYGIATCPHIGLMPQRQIASGGFKVQGKEAESAFSILENALALEAAGACFLLLEGVPARVAEVITNHIEIPTIGIGAGPHTDSQVLVQLDMLGGFDNFTPKFVKKYANLLEYSTSAISSYADDVRNGAFPAKEHCYTMKTEQYHRFMDMVEQRK